MRKVGILGVLLSSALCWGKFFNSQAFAHQQPAVESAEEVGRTSVDKKSTDFDILTGNSAVGETVVLQTRSRNYGPEQAIFSQMIQTPRTSAKEQEVPTVDRTSLVLVLSGPNADLLLNPRVISQHP